MAKIISMRVLLNSGPGFYPITNIDFEKRICTYCIENHSWSCPFTSIKDIVIITEGNNGIEAGSSIR